MKFTGRSHLPPVGIAFKSRNPSPDSDLQPAKPFPLRKPKTPRTRLKIHGGPSGKRSRPETPLLKWKIHDDPLEEDQKSSSVAGFRRRPCRNAKKQTEVAVSARRLAAGLWRLHLPEMATGVSRKRLQHGNSHVGLQFIGRSNGMTHASDPKNASQSPCSISGTKSGHFREEHKLPLSYNFHNYMVQSMEDEFHAILGISWPLWIYAIVCIFVNVHGIDILI